MAAETMNSKLSVRRFYVCLALIGLAYFFLLYRSWYLQTPAGYQAHGLGNKETTRVLKAKRGVILDRNGKPLAVSTIAYSIGIDLREFRLPSDEVLAQAADVLDIKFSQLKSNLIKAQTTTGKKPTYIPLTLRASPQKMKAFRALKISGTDITTEYKRFYPSRESFANVVGITDIDDRGLEGMEMAYDSWLRGSPGKQRVVRDNKARIIEDEVIEVTDPGRDLILTLDKRLQHFAFTELQKTVTEQRAKAGSIVILDATNGHILSMVNVPSYNPNNRATMTPEVMRNQAAVNVFEPGSTIKPITIAAALSSGKFQINSTVDVGQGRFQIDEYTIKDLSTKGKVTLEDILIHSSNIGASKIALQLGSERIRQSLIQFGFGDITNSGYPGESPGILRSARRWSKSELATHGYGYGFSVSLLQLARAYAIIANRGYDQGVTFQFNPTDTDGAQVSHAAYKGRQVLSSEIAEQIMQVLGRIVRDGTGKSAQINGYGVGGKTGTIRVSTGAGGYDDKNHNSLFVGISPLSNPRVVCAVMVNQPQKEYYGSKVAAPLFAKVTSVALRLLGITADRINIYGEQL